MAIAAGEAKNPRKNIPKAIKRVYIRILLFYILGVICIGISVPGEYNRYMSRSSPQEVDADPPLVLVQPTTLILRNTRTLLVPPSSSRSTELVSRPCRASSTPASSPLLGQRLAPTCTPLPEPCTVSPLPVELLPFLERPTRWVYHGSL